MKVNKKKKGISTQKAMNLIIGTLGIFTLGYLIAFGFLIKSTHNRGTNTDVLPQLCFTNKCFYTEFAITQEEHEKGLMFREKLSKDKGMLFIFEKPGIYRFWMKNTLIPLDMLRLDENRNVIYIQTGVQPCPEKFSKINACSSYGSITGFAKYIFEINAGLVDEFGIKIGDSAKTIGTGK